MWTSLNKKLYILIGIILLIGVITGILFVLMLDEATKELILTNVNELIQNFGGIRINNLVEHVVILSSLVILSIFIVGIPILLFFIFFNGFSIGFIISVLTSIFGIKGLLYSLIYIIISKGIYLVFLSVLSVSLIKITKYVIDIFINKNNSISNLKIYLKKCLLCIAIILVCDTFLYFFGINIINIFNFLLN